MKRPPGRRAFFQALCRIKVYACFRENDRGIMDRTVEDLVRIANAGGGLKLDGAKFSVDALARIAHAAKHKGA